MNPISILTFVFAVYVVYSVLFLAIADKNNIPFNYIGWKVKYPNRKKRLTLYLISGIIVQLVIGCSFVVYKMCNVNIFNLDWFESK